MARPLRVNVAGEWYHLACGQTRQRTYEDARDYQDFLSRLKEMSGCYGLEAHGYVLMPNHYHLIARNPKGTPAKRSNASTTAMRRGETGDMSARAMNSRGGSRGSWWKRIVVEEGQWLLELSLYVHFNPVAARWLGQAAESGGTNGAGNAGP